MTTKQSDITKAQLLAMAGECIAEAGATTFTLETVAKRAGVSKGALLHHFSTKSLLIEEVVKDLVLQFWKGVQHIADQDKEPHCRMTRAYVQAIALRDRSQSRKWSGLATAFAVDPSLMHLWRESLSQYQRPVEVEVSYCESAWVARLAADSLWSAELFGTHSISPSARERLIARLVSLTMPTSPGFQTIQPERRAA